MSYPPQQPGPGGYGPGGQPQPGPPTPPGARPGGYSPQHPRPYGPAHQGFGGFGQQPPGAPPPGGPPPRRRRTGLLVSVGLATLLVIAAVLVTGLVSPGWMLPDDARQRTTAQPGPGDVLRTVVDAMNARDIPRVKRHLCRDADFVDPLVEPIPQGARIQITAPPPGNGGPNRSGRVAAELPGAGQLPFRVDLQQAGGTWCVRAMRSPTNQ